MREAIKSIGVKTDRLIASLIELRLDGKKRVG
jgi:hypothetical protein